MHLNVKVVLSAKIVKFHLLVIFSKSLCTCTMYTVHCTVYINDNALQIIMVPKLNLLVHHI